MALFCPYCRMELRAADANSQAAIGTCRACRHVFKIATPDGRRNILKTALPERMRLWEEGADLLIQRKWLDWRAIVGLTIAAPLCGYLIFSYPRAEHTHVRVVVLTFLGSGLLSAYFALARLFNKTLIRLTPSALHITHGPLPWPGRKVPIGDIEQLYCAQYGGDEAETSYKVFAILRGGKKLKLLTAPEPQQALYIEQAIEQHLGIADRAVAGELPSVQG